MNFVTEEITQQIGEATREFAQRFIKPHVMEWDEKQIFPKELFHEMGKLGIMGVLCPRSTAVQGSPILNIKW